MDKIRIKGNANLLGSINICGSKNAALPVLVSSLLSKENLELNNIPKLNDIDSMIELLKGFGVKIYKKSNSLILNSENIINKTANYDLVRKMRASILVLGPLLSRFKEVKISLPGGCAIGTRPIDIHLDSLKKLGVNFELKNGFVIGRIKDKLIGSEVNLSFPSVGATENLLMAASLAEGKTVIRNAAKEPEVVDLAKCLISMGASIFGEGTDLITIEGVKYLKESSHTIIPDRIVAGTFLIAAVMLNKKFILNNLISDHLKSLINILKNMGANITIEKNSITVNPNKELIGAKIQTAPYPGFPTDLQAQMMALMSIAKGSSIIIEKIFENRFMHVAELNRLGANIKIKKDTAYIQGERKFVGAPVMASDLRASVSLVLAGLCAEGETLINRVYHLDRGYEKIEETLGKCGPKITREK